MAYNPQFDKTPQGIFDFVARHLLRQGHKAMIGGQCQYRDPQGRMCAVGCLISDEEFVVWQRQADQDINGVAIGGLLGAGVDLPAWMRENYDLLDILQDVHDFFGPADWRSNLNKVAEKYDLDPAAAFEDHTVHTPDVSAT